MRMRGSEDVDDAVFDAYARGMTKSQNFSTHGRSSTSVDQALRGWRSTSR